MRRFRTALTLVAILAVLFDLNEFLIIQQHGFPPDPIVDVDGRITFAIPSASDRIRYVRFLLGIGVVEAVVFALTWKAWRR